MHAIRVLAVVSTLLACARWSERPPPPVVEAPLALTRSSLAGEAPDGLSDLAVDANGHVFAIPERQRVLVPITLDEAGHGTAGAALPLVGIGEDFDTESLAWLPDGKLALGTETQHTRASDLILVLQLEGGLAKVVDSLSLSYVPWGVMADGNHGLEGLCVAGNTLVAGSEVVVARDGKRLAPLARYDLTRRVWSHHLLELTTATGKISGLTCRVGPDGAVTAVAIERHYGVARLLRFVVPSAATLQIVKPELRFDLAAHTKPLPNFEGIIFRGEDGFELITDNHTAIRTGPTELASLVQTRSAPAR